MNGTDIGKTARRLRWAVWILWGCIILAYVAGRLGLSLRGAVEVQAHSTVAESGTPMIVADITILLLSVALYQLSKMLGAIGEGDLFSSRVVGAFRSFAFWLLVVALAWVVAPIVAVFLTGPDAAHRLEFKLQLRDVLTIGIALILFLVARLLERARTIDEEMREIV
jgi:membrane protein DedA with SNARE-associated domain